MSSEHRERTYTTARRETIGAINGVVAEVLGPDISIGGLEFIDEVQIEAFNANQFKQTYSITGLASRFGIPDNAFSVRRSSGSSFQDGKLDLVLPRTIGDSLTHLHDSDPKNKIPLSNAANYTFIYGMIELLGQLADHGEVLEGSERAMREPAIDALREQLGHNELITPEQAQQFGDYISRARNNMTFRTRGVALEASINGKPFYELMQSADYEMRRFLAGNLFQIFADRMGKKSRWYQMPDNMKAFIPSTKNNPVTSGINEFLKVNGYFGMSLMGVIEDYGAGEMGRKVQRDVVGVQDEKVIDINSQDSELDATEKDVLNEEDEFGYMEEGREELVRRTRKTVKKSRNSFLED